MYFWDDLVSSMCVYAGERKWVESFHQTCKWLIFMVVAVGLEPLACEAFSYQDNNLHSPNKPKHFNMGYKVLPRACSHLSAMGHGQKADSRQ